MPELKTDIKTQLLVDLVSADRLYVKATLLHQNDVDRLMAILREQRNMLPGQPTGE